MEDTGTPVTATPEVSPAITEPAASSVQTGAAEGQGDPAKEAAKEAIRKHKLKVDGQEVEVDDEELKRGYTHQRAANKKLQEGLKAKKQAEEFITLMKNPEKVREVMEKLGYTRQQIREMSEKFLTAELEEEMLDPKEKELRATKKQLDDYRAKEKAEKERIEKQRDDELRAKFSKDYEATFVDAIKTVGLPPTKGMVAEMAKYIRRAADLKYELTPADAAKLVKEDVESSYQRLFGEADAEILVKLIGEQGLQKVRGYDTSRLKDPAANLKTPEHQAETSRKREQSKRMTPAEWRAFNRGR